MRLRTSILLVISLLLFLPSFVHGLTPVYTNYLPETGQNCCGMNMTMNLSTVNDSYVTYWLPEPMQGAFNAGNFSIFNVSDPTSAQQAATMNYVLANAGGGLSDAWNISYLLLDGSRAMTGALNMDTHQINNVVDPINLQDAMTLNYADAHYAVSGDLTDYAYLPGRSGGQELTGGTDAGDSLILGSSVAGGGNVTAQLGSNSGTSKFLVRDLDGFDRAYIDANGNALINRFILNDSFFYRSVNDDNMGFYGGDVSPPYPAILRLYGGLDGSVFNGGAVLSVGSADGTTPEIVFYTEGRTDTPTLNLHNNRITSLGEPTNLNDATTKAYVDFHDGYTINVMALSYDPAASDTVYFGANPSAPFTVGGYNRIYIRKDGYITGAEINQNSTSHGSNEDWDLYVRRNDATDYFIARVSAATTVRTFSNWTPEFANKVYVGAGDYVEIKSVQPNWLSGSPKGTTYGGYLYVNTT